MVWLLQMLGPLLTPLKLLTPILKPVIRLIISTVAVPIFRIFTHRVIRTKEWDEEFEKDLEQWFRGAVLLLIASANMEQALFGWVPLDFRAENAWLLIGGRLLLAMGVIEAMPDQELFSIIYPGPPKLKWLPAGLRASIGAQWRPLARGLVNQHLNRSSPVFAIMAAIFEGPVGWACYALAIIQYLIIGLATSRDRAYTVLTRFDEEIARRRQELIDEFDLPDGATEPPKHSESPRSS